MQKKKIAILGGGFGAMTTAYFLSKTPELRNEYDITVHQMGWRLGGKCATGRDEENRILEHGLHFWFGCYDNAWAMLREIYEHWEKPPNCPFETGFDAFDAQSYTPLWTRIGDSWGFYNVDWPTNDDKLGDGKVLLSVWGILTQIADLLKKVLHFSEAELAAEIGASRNSEGGEALNTAHNVLRQGRKSYGADAEEDVLTQLDIVRDQFSPAACKIPANADADPHFAPIRDLISNILHLGAVFSRGILWDIAIGGKDIDDLNEIEFRDWLKSHGGSAELVDTSAPIKAIYDCCFWYTDGDHAKPNVGTGTALRVIMRIVATYKTAVMFTLRTGMAEAVVAPMYELMLSRGVKFEFFHRVSGLELDSAGTGIERVVIDRQAVARTGDYDPTRFFNGIPTWPSEPFWDQLENGNKLKASKVNFESHWSPDYPVEALTLTRGVDFDMVVLGISMGGYKSLNSQDVSLAQPLIDKGGAFADMVSGIGLVPTMAAQIWLDETTQGLGWKDRPATVAGPDPMDIWADMSQEIPNEGGDAKSVHYLCGAYHTMLNASPAHDKSVPATALSEVTAALDTWLADAAPIAWPDRDAATPVPVTDRYIRANIDPTECCVGSAAGEVAKRLRVDETGFDNLYLAGCYTRTGLNTTCVESAVMSGMQASRAICGSPKHVLGENFILDDEGE